MKQILTLPATEIAQLIKDREVKARAVLEAHIAHIKKVNPRLNALVDDRFEEARFEADTADKQCKERSPEELPPFHGVPCTIKESFQLTDMPNTAGLLSRKSLRSPKDAITVKRLRDAGAIPMGVSNTSELCMWMESNNKVYGRTNNPYDSERIAGGSSGGEGALVGAGASPFGLGSDIGGSIRMPAFFNGVFGHKPTAGMVPVSGQFPIPEPEGKHFDCTGPLCRSAKDLMPLLRLLAGPDGEDESCIDYLLQDPAQVDIASLQVVSVPDNGLFTVSQDLKERQEEVASWFIQQGATVQLKRFHNLRASFDIWSSMLGQTSKQNTFRHLLGYNSKRSLLWGSLPGLMKSSPHTLPAVVLALVENLDKHTPKRTKRFVALGQELREELLAAMGTKGVMLFPSYTRPAPKHNAPLLPPLQWVYTAIFNVLGFPVTQVPLGLNQKGLPLGVQVVSSPGQDHLSIAVAIALEEAFGGWVMPPERNH